MSKRSPSQSKKNKSTPPESPRKPLLIAGLIILILGNALLWTVLGVERAYSGKLLPGTEVNGILLSGLTRAQAQEKLSTHYNDKLNRPITLQVDTLTHQTTLADLGYGTNIDQTVTALFTNPAPWYKRLLALLKPSKSIYDSTIILNDATFDTHYTAFSQKLSRSAKDAELVLKDNKAIISPAETGITIDKAAVQRALHEHVTSDATTITLPYQAQTAELANESQLTQAAESLNQTLTQPLTLQIDGASFTLDASTIFSFAIFTIQDGQLTYTFDEALIKQKITEIAKKTDVKAVNKTILSTDQSTIIEGKDGKKLNVVNAATQVHNRLKAAPSSEPLIITSDTVARKVISESPEFQLGRFLGKYIEVDLSKQRLHIIEGNVYGRAFPVSTGAWSTPTPIGEFTILNHIANAWSKRYELYMPFWMAIKPENGTYDGYGIHALPYWPSGKVEGASHLGRPVSHGCIRLSRADAEFVYNWAENGTKVVIHQ